jgi:hypothetical protein
VFFGLIAGWHKTPAYLTEVFAPFAGYNGKGLGKIILTWKDLTA